MTSLTLTYHITADGLPIRDLERDVGSAFVAMRDLKRWLGGTSIINDGNISISEVAQGVFGLQLDIGTDTIDIAAGGLGRLLTLLFGNPFRSEKITGVVLHSITTSSDIASVLPGPAIPNASQFPILSVPLPVGLSETERLGLIEILAAGGVNFVTESPISDIDDDTLRRLLGRLVERGVPFRYFANGVSLLPSLQQRLDTLMFFKDVSGLRICPFSAGLNICAYIRSRGVTLYGYNLLSVVADPRNAMRLSYHALTTVLRLIGCDFINIGLDSTAMIARGAAHEVVAAASRPFADRRIAPAVPFFTGSITPRRAYQLIRDYGSAIGLHVKKPLLRDGDDLKITKSNAMAFREAIALATTGRDLDDAIGRENSNTEHIRAYENRYATKK